MSSSSNAASAARLVRQFLSTHPHLNTRQLFSLGTADERPVLQPLVGFNQDGSIRMKRVSNMREGKRTWVPSPVARFPHHPFRSVSYLKDKVLHSLEAQELIHKSRIEVELEDDKERLDAVRKAGVYTRRNERKAQKSGLPVPPPVQPATTKTTYAWKMGPAPHSRYRSSSGGAAINDGTTSPPAEASLSAEEVDRKWEQAYSLESAMLLAEQSENEAIEARRADRKERFKALRDREKVEKAENTRTGKIHDIHAEKARKAALARVQEYALQTGEDVSGWYEELGEEVRPAYEQEGWAGDEGRVMYGEAAKAAVAEEARRAMGQARRALDRARGGIDAYGRPWKRPVFYEPETRESGSRSSNSDGQGSSEGPRPLEPSRVHGQEADRRGSSTRFGLRPAIESGRLAGDDGAAEPRSYLGMRDRERGRRGSSREGEDGRDAGYRVSEISSPRPRFGLSADGGSKDLVQRTLSTSVSRFTPSQESRDPHQFPDRIRRGDLDSVTAERRPAGNTFSGAGDCGYPRLDRSRTGSSRFGGGRMPRESTPHFGSGGFQTGRDRPGSSFTRGGSNPRSGSFGMRS